MLRAALPFLLLSLAAPVANATSIRAAVTELRRGAGVTVEGEAICSSRPLPLFYERRNFAPGWSARDGDDLLAAIRNAGADGLTPADYHLTAIARSIDRDSRDLLLTDGFFLLASHLLSGRVDPESVEPTWCLAPRTNDLVPALETALELHDVGGTLARMPPAHRDYQVLKAALAGLRGIEARGRWPVVNGDRSLRLGDQGTAVAQLTARLVASNDIEQVTDRFDATVDTAIRRFQRRHDLAVDGVAGLRTRAALNVPVARRIREIELNLERWRWLPATLGDPYALINIPAYSLVVSEHDRPVLSMRIVVGKEFTRTPIFSGEITRVILSPCWNVPASIASRELWPKERRTPGYFAREHIKVLKGGRLRQTPGSWNSLGLIKFDIPNRYGVYLHDTPAKSLFDEHARAFSHGCMRVEKPVELAAWLLRDRPEWTREQIVESSQAGTERAVAVRKPLPVHVLYWTVYLDEGEEVHFAPDVYDRDAKLDAALQRPPAHF